MAPPTKQFQIATSARVTLLVHYNIRARRSEIAVLFYVFFRGGQVNFRADKWFWSDG